VRMVKTTIGEVDKGRFLAMKLLFEMVGLYPAAGEEESPGGGFDGKDTAAQVATSGRACARHGRYQRLRTG
jgi:hypothetical protein